MPHADTDGIEIFYEVDGAPDDPVLVLVAGGGAQLIAWPDQLVALLVAEGFRVVRMDNRDTGLSQRFGGPDDVDGGYELSDLADDIVRVLDHLGAPSAHLVGHSMGGMMAQLVALDHPERVRSLGLLSTIPGQDPRYILHGEREELLSPPPRLTREQAVAFAVEAATPTGPHRYDPQLEWHAWAAGLAYDRGYAPEGFARQWAALRRAPERLDRLRGVTVPTLVLHGRDDDVLHWCAAVDMADAIAGSELRVYPDMGHLVPWELWPDLVAAIAGTARRAT
ncbi:alpha/beta fold hydrolase [Jiangella anatolica]|uniref:Alpha/beta hydrolase n=1 Tax=Jiangella anatolica TaxID=2670374 RepID=A0A2W2BFD0_9ACTN|nr:alpha/beta fold hydrolase [Jiangella anatolica]PZF86311.1 alpha/beta hydrolase [Jiangella anatolica]